MICARRALCNNEQGRKAHRSIAAALGALFAAVLRTSTFSRRSNRENLMSQVRQKEISKEIGEVTLPRKREKEISKEMGEVTLPRKERRRLQWEIGEVTLPRKGEKEISGGIGEVTLPRKREGRSLSNANSSSWPVVGSLVSSKRAQTHLRL